MSLFALGTVVDKAGYIAHIGSREDRGSVEYLELVQQGRISKERVVELDADSWILPGFVDTHSELNPLRDH